MGLYIEVDRPLNKATQIKALDDRVQLIDQGQESWDNCPKDMLPVCVVVNFTFEAAAVAYSNEEFSAFRDPRDRRPKVWLYVPIETIYQHAPYAADYLNQQEN